MTPDDTELDGCDVDTTDGPQAADTELAEHRATYEQALRALDG